MERLISIIYKLLNHEVLSASTLAEEFQVSPRTIYRDIDVICAAGFPVISHQGLKGGYGMMDGYKMDKSLLGSYDVDALITVLSSLSTVFEDAQMTGPSLPEHPWSPRTIRDHFDEPTLDMNWIFLRNPAPDSWTLTENPGQLILRGHPVSLDDVGNPAFVGRRLSHFLCNMAAELDYEPDASGGEAGLTVFMNDKYHYDLAVTQIDGQKKIILRRTVGSLRTEQILDCEKGPVVLQIKADRNHFTFLYQQGSSDAIEVGSGETHLLSTEVASGFTGVIIAMYAYDPSGERTPASFDWFDYEPLKE